MLSVEESARKRSWGAGTKKS